jgi:hypothetical protein
MQCVGKTRVMSGICYLFPVIERERSAYRKQHTQGAFKKISSLVTIHRGREQKTQRERQRKRESEREREREKERERKS